MSNVAFYSSIREVTSESKLSKSYKLFISSTLKSSVCYYVLITGGVKLYYYYEDTSVFKFSFVFKLLVFFDVINLLAFKPIALPYNVPIFFCPETPCV